MERYREEGGGKERANSYSYPLTQWEIEKGMLKQEQSKRRGKGKKLFYSQMMSLRSSLDALMMRIMAKDDTDGRIATVSSIHPCLSQTCTSRNTHTHTHTVTHSTHCHCNYPDCLCLLSPVHYTLVTALSPLIIITVLQFLVHDVVLRTFTLAILSRHRRWLFFCLFVLSLSLSPIALASTDLWQLRRERK